MPLKWRAFMAATAVMSLAGPISAQTFSYYSPNLLPRELVKFDTDRDPKCPPCFNCNLNSTPCQQFGNCTSTTGHCSCPVGFGDIDCSKVLCGSPALGLERPMRPDTNKDVPLEERPQCQCDDGWSGLNCNVCEENKGCAALKPEGAEDSDMVCYKQGMVVKQNHNQCDITNAKIVEALKPQKPQATFSCHADSKQCNFQMWVGGIESFYCSLDTCEFKIDNQDRKNVTEYKCENVKCDCIKDRKLCESDALDIGPLLRDNIKGPGILRTTSTKGGSPNDGSIFSEPALDDLVSSVFGDDSIMLQCDQGECLYKTNVPGFEKPIKTINTPLIAGVISGCSLFIVAAVLVVWWFTRRNNRKRYGPIQVGDEDDLLMADHKPAALHFEQVSYAVNGKQILHGVQGAVRPGEILAIMGGSGAGKTTFLDILARKNKKGVAQGNFYVNGETISNSDYRSVIGFVDQDDVMLPTLTVHETILDSAKLRLPADMSLAAKEQKVEDVEKQLGIYHIRDSVIGSEEVNGRGISGGEKRRVGIACELITSPSILFLDEPTSGLDAYNAFNVIECLVTLVKTYNRTVVFTIHQPRSNIVALFDQLILLAKGRTVYSGPFSSCQAYFDSIGYSCPPGFNIADYLVDLSMHAGRKREPMADLFNAREENETRSSSLHAIKSIASGLNVSTAERDGEDSSDSSNKAPERPSVESPRVSMDNRRVSIKDEQDRKLFSRKKRPGVETPTSQAEEEQSLLSKDSGQPWMRLSRTSGAPPPQVLDDPHQLPPEQGADGTDLDNIISSYFTSDVATSIMDDIRTMVNNARTANGAQNADGSVKGSTRMKGYRKTGIVGQFGILSIRTWRNLYRNPFLMLTHYAIAIVLAVFLGILFYGLEDDLPGFQNRLGFFFFVLALFGFGTLTSLTTFAQERLLFMRERAKGYYRPVSYFAAKVVFDIIPLRLIPPAIFGAIVYPMTGLVPDWTHFSLFMSFLILFNFAAATICLFLGVIFRNGGIANLAGSMVMLFSLLFAGLLLNKESMPAGVQWLQNVSASALIGPPYKYSDMTINSFQSSTLDMKGLWLMRCASFRCRTTNTGWTFKFLAPLF